MGIRRAAGEETMGAEETLAAKFAALLPHLDERQRRLLMGAEARSLGHGGIKVVARAAGAREATVSRGVDELDAGRRLPGRIRKPGGGRKPMTHTDPGLATALLGLVEPGPRGDQESPMRWTTKSMRRLQTELAGAGHAVSVSTVAKLLKSEGFTLRGHARTMKATAHPDRDAQFRYINDQAIDHLAAGDPVISIDINKKELVSQFKNPGRGLLPRGQPLPAGVGDFMNPDMSRATPYRIHEVVADARWVSVAADHDTAELAVAAVGTWWRKVGSAAHPNASRLLITAAGGAAAGYRARLWRTELAHLAEDNRLAITVCHLPPGTSKWNKIEHRLFAHISMSWPAIPVANHEVIVNTVSATTTHIGLTVTAELDTAHHPAGTGAADRQAHDLEPATLRRHTFHGDWNYCLKPNPSNPP
jgi:Rhodopirellula transposase DDE domain